MPYETSGTLTTQARTFDEPVQPDLSGLVYSLNGQSISVDVVGSPGTASEETVTQSLDGASSYSLSWTNSHTDFVLQFSLSTTDDSVTPTVDEADLTATVEKTSLPTPEADATTLLPAATLETLVAASTSQLDASWTVAAADGQQRVEYRPTDESAWQTWADGLPLSTTAESLTGLLNGEAYDARIVTYTADAESASNVLSATTDHAAIAGLLADASVEDELTTTWDDTANYGDYHLQVRVSGSGDPWGATDDRTVPESDTDATTPNLLDGEEYDLRVRHETEHGAGEWAEISPVTLLPAPSGLTSPAHGTTTVDLDWLDNADNEDDQLVRREEEVAGSFEAVDTVATLSPNVESHTDGTPLPDTTYRYRIRTRTEHVVADSGTITVTTDATGRPRDRAIPPSGWYLRVEHPDGDVREPRILEGAQFLPTLNGLPTAEVPVPRDESWQADRWGDGGVTVELWRDGQRLPIDSLQEPTDEADRTILALEGGDELDQDIEHEVTSEAADVEVEDLVSTETGYASTVDDPATTTLQRTLLAADTTTEFVDSVEAGQPAATDPWEIVNGEVHALQTAWTREAEDTTTESGTSALFDGRFSAGESVEWDGSGQGATYEFTPAYTVPASAVGVYLRWETNNAPELEMSLNGTTWTIITDGGTVPTLEWQDVAGDPLSASDGYAAEGGGDLQAGVTYTLSIDSVTGGGTSPRANGDAVAPLDTRWTYTLDNTISNGERVVGPETKPDAVPVPFATIPSAYNVVGVDATSQWDDVGGGQQLEASNDGGATWPLSVSNSTTLDADFSADGSQLKLRATLSRYGTRTGDTPTSGFESQSLQQIDAVADLENRPILVNQTYTGPLDEVLTEIADYSGSVWELTYEPGTGFTVQYTRPGQREVDATPAVVDYSVSRDLDTYERVIVEGGRQPGSERLDASLDSWQDLADEPLIPGTESVTDPDTGTSYQRETDYKIDNRDGRIQPLSGGDISAGQTIAVGYDYQVTGSAEVSGAPADPRTLRVSLPAVTSPRAADQAALQVLDRIEEPVTTANVELARDLAGVSLVDDLSLEGVPTSAERMQTWDVETTPESVRLRLGSRDAVADVIESLQSRLSAASARV